MTKKSIEDQITSQLDINKGFWLRLRIDQFSFWRLRWNNQILLQARSFVSYLWQFGNVQPIYFYQQSSSLLHLQVLTNQILISHLFLSRLWRSQYLRWFFSCFPLICFLYSFQIPFLPLPPLFVSIHSMLSSLPLTCALFKQSSCYWYIILATA